MTPIESLSVPPLAQRIREARNGAGLSQEAFAAAVGTSRRHVMRWERKPEKGPANRPTQRFLERIAEVTGQPVEFFSDDPQEAAPAGEPFRGGPRPAPDADGAGDGRAGRRATDRVTEGEAA